MISSNPTSAKMASRIGILLMLLTAILLVIYIIDAGNLSGQSVEEPISAIHLVKEANSPEELTAVGNSCRYGAASLNEVFNPFLEDLGVGWILNFGIDLNQTVPDGIEYVPMIRLSQKRDSQGNRLPEYIIEGPQLTDEKGGLGPIVSNYPNRLWIVGNEIDRVVWQDDIEPEVYAEAYHDIYHFIKDRDSSAQIAVSGLVGVTPNRMEYLNIVWDSTIEKYGTPMSVDVWTMHPYIFPEARWDDGAIMGSNASIALGTSCWENRDRASCSDIKWESLSLPPWISPAPSCGRDEVYCYAEHDDIDVFAEQVVMMRQWMKNHGQQYKPLLNTEFAVLYSFDDEGDLDPTTCFLKDEFGNCFPEERVIEFMQKAVQYQENATSHTLGYPYDNDRLVQQWLWYAMNDGADYTPNALANDHDNPTKLTPIGEAYKQLIAGDVKKVNLLGVDASTTVVHGTTSAEIWAAVRNNGNVPTAASFTVKFYEDKALTQLIDEVTVPPALGGCARHETKVFATWNDLTPIQNQFWAVISSAEDTDNSDNKVTGYVLVDPFGSYLPNIPR